jgi:serine/threonine protein kinase/Tol biopolymer transport system component
MPEIIGQTIGNYRVLAKLGEGGMGVVYSAEDTRLGRRVAVKFLSEEMARHPQALERFEREARAASALNHPNIATVYDVGTHEGRPYLVMELLEGQPLNERLQGRTIDTGTLLDWAIQAADALDAAHAKGIVHRDVKPGNLFVNARGQVKVLDFGLAKVAEATPDAGQMTAGPTMDALLTSPGVAIGTVSYMSPEQARGDELDARSDIFSLGCVFYEAATGQRAFAGKTPAIIFHAILERTPTPARELNPALPPKLEEIIAKTLEKDREMRYQSAGELRADLKRLRRDLDSARSATSNAPASAAPSAGTDSSTIMEVLRKSGMSAAQGSPTRPQGVDDRRRELRDELKRLKRQEKLGRDRMPGGAPGPTMLPPEQERHGVMRLIQGRRPVMRVVVLALFALLVWRMVKTERKAAPGSAVNPSTAPASVFPSLTLTRLTTAGNIFGAAISRDGKYVALISVNGFLKEGIAMRQISTGSTVELVQPQSGDLRSLAFSPDGSFLYYLQSSPGGEKSRSYYQVPSLGGVPRLVASGILSEAALSFDGMRVAYVGIAPGGTKPQLLSAPVGEQSEPPRVLLADVAQTSFDHLAWSPDGKILALVDSHPDSAGLYAGVSTLRLDTGPGQNAAQATPQPLGTKRWRGASGGIAWLQDGKGLLLNARDLTGKPSQVWFVSYPDGVARQMTSGLTNHSYSISITGDDKSFVTVQNDEIMNLWAAPKGEDKSARQITTGRSDGVRGLAWTPDGKIVYSSNSSGTWQLWLTGAEGGAPHQLTSDSKYHVWPTVCRGTGRVYYSSDSSGGFQLWSIGLDDGQVRQESSGDEQFFDADCSPDGTWFAGLVAPKGAPVDVFNTGRPVRLERETGKVTTLFDGEATFPKISPDGRHVAFLYHPSAPGGTAAAGSRICVVSATGGAVEKSFDVPATAFAIPDIRWTPNGKELVYLELRAGATNLWLQPLDGGKPKQLTHFADGIIYNFVWSYDGKVLALSRGTYLSDAVLFSEN